MKNSLIAALLLAGCWALASAFFPSEKVSLNDLKVVKDQAGIPVHFLNDVPFNGTTYDHFPEKDGYSEFEIKNGYIQKLSAWYEDGSLQRENLYQNGILHGRSASFHRNGQVFSDEFYSEGQKEGKQHYYNCDGSLRYEEDYLGGFRLINLEFEKKPCEKDCKIDFGC